MDGVKLDVIDGEHQSLILPARRLVFSMASKGVVLPANSQKSQEQKKKMGLGGRVFTLGPYLRGS